MNTNRSNSSSGEETKMVGSGQDKYMDSISSSSSECPPLCQRCSSDDAEVVCLVCGNIQLCSSCDDLIHSIGVYEKHKRVSVEEFGTSHGIESEIVHAEIEISPMPQNLSKEAQSVVNKLQQKLDYLTSKTSECDVVFNSYTAKSKEIEMNFESSEFSLKKDFEYIKEMVSNKEQELLAELAVIKAQKLQDLNSAKTKINELKDGIGDVCQIIRQGISKPEFVMSTGQKFVDKKVELCEDEISSVLFNREPLDTNAPKMLDLDSLNRVLSTLTFE
jgi:hypothetical protein